MTPAKLSGQIVGPWRSRIRPLVRPALGGGSAHPPPAGPPGQIGRQSRAGAAAAPAPTHAAAAPSGSVAVQVGAYSTAALGEASWNRMVTAHDVLKGLGHRVVEGKADIGTVYRLQALTSDLQSANALCSKLQADGVKCQVKR